MKLSTLHKGALFEMSDSDENDEKIITFDEQNDHNEDNEDNDHNQPNQYLPSAVLEFYAEMGPPFKQYERSISTWKTERINKIPGVVCVKINDSSDGNGDLFGKIYRVVRYDFNGQKTIFSTEKEY
jgi:hypothetical protein